jgi:hypothetical protein
MTLVDRLPGPHATARSRLMAKRKVPLPDGQHLTSMTKYDTGGSPPGAACDSTKPPHGKARGSVSGCVLCVLCVVACSVTTSVLFVFLFTYALR